MLHLVTSLQEIIMVRTFKRIDALQSTTLSEPGGAVVLPGQASGAMLPAGQ